MTTETNDDGTKPKDDEPMFTRAQFAREVAKQVRDKVASALSEYGDLDELRKKAADADKSKSQLDRIEEKLAASEKRAAEAERNTLIRDVADELGISMRLARRLEGTTKAELMADGRETMEELGIKSSKSKAGTKGEGSEDETDGEDDDSATGEKPQQQAAPTRTARPRENLRGGAPRTQAEPEETNPLKLVADIPRR